MLVLVPSASHIWVKVIPGGRVHCHWKEPSLATVQEMLEADTTLSGPGGTDGSKEGDCWNMMLTVGRETEADTKHCYVAFSPTTDSYYIYFHQSPLFFTVIKFVCSYPHT